MFFYVSKKYSQNWTFLKEQDKILIRHPDIFFPQANGPPCILPGIWPFHLRDHCQTVMNATLGLERSGLQPWLQFPVLPFTIEFHSFIQ